MSLSVGEKLAKFASLSKFRLSSFVSLSAVSGYLMAKSAYTDVIPKYAETSAETLSKTPIDFSALLDAIPTEASIALSSQPYSLTSLTCLATGTLLASASANTWNQCTEIDHDSKMKRTWNRMLPKNKLTLGEAVSFGVASGVSGVALLSMCNPLTAVLGAANIGLYAGVYTPLKRIHYLNTWMGAFVGAIPPLMGWAAYTDSLTHNVFLTQDISAFGSDLGGWAIAAILYGWQIPHFLSLNWMHREDYKTAGYQMLSTVPGGLTKTARVTYNYSIAMIPISVFLPAIAGIVNWWYPITAGALHLFIMIRPARQFYNNPNKDTARNTFLKSLIYLPMIILLLLLHKKNSSPLSDKVKSILEDPLIKDYQKKPPSTLSKIYSQYFGHNIQVEESQIIPLLHHVLLSRLYVQGELPFNNTPSEELKRLSFRIKNTI